MQKILSGKYDSAVNAKVNKVYSSITRGNDLRLEKRRVKYDLRKYYFINNVVNIWNSLQLLNYTFLSDTADTFKSRLDKFWQHQYIVFDFKNAFQGTGSRSLQK